MPTTRTYRPGPRNRVGLVLTGAVMLVGGLVAVGLGTGTAAQALAGVGISAAPPAPEASLGFSTDHLWWQWAIVAAGGVLLAVLALSWLLAQLPRTVRNRPFRLQDESTGGTTSVETGAIDAAVTAEIGQINGVIAASSAVRGTSTAPTVEIRLTVNERADIQGILDQIEGPVLANLTQALDGRISDLKIQLDITGQTTSADSVRLASDQRVSSDQVAVPAA